MADIGYESESNDAYLEGHHQISHIKRLNDEQSKKTGDKQAIEKKENMNYNATKNFYFCTNQQNLVNTGIYIKENRKTKFKSEITTYHYQSCEEYPLKPKCTTHMDGKKIQVSKNFIKLNEQSLENIKNDLEMCLRVYRSIPAEGTFEILKEDHHFAWLLTRGNEQVLTELLLLGISFNLRKLHNRIQNERSDHHLLKK